MKKLIFTVVFLMLATVSQAADVNIYVDAGASTGGDGSIGSPWDEIADIDIDALVTAAGNGDDPYINVTGTFTENFSFTGKSGASGHPITLQSYSESQALFTPPSGVAVQILNCSYWAVKNIKIYNPNSTGFRYLMEGASGDHTGISLDGVTSYGCLFNGINFDVKNDTAYKLTTGIISNCYTYDNERQGYAIQGNIDGVTLSNNRSDGDAVGGPSWGFLTGVYHDTFTSAWDSEGGTVYSRAHTTAVIDVVPSETVYGYLTSVGSSPAAGEYWWDSGNTKLYVNVGVDANTKTIRVFEYNIKNITITNCTAENTKDPTTNEGHGIGFEFGTVDSTITKCISRNNAGNGIATMMTKNCSITKNIIQNNPKDGISTQYGDDLTIYDNTISGTSTDGIYILRWNDMTIKNNIIAGMNVGIRTSPGTTTPTIVNDYNGYYDNNSNVAGITIDVNKITTDPRLLFSGKLKSDSPSLGAGTTIAGVNDSGVDMWGNDFDRENMGAYWGRGIKPGPVDSGIKSGIMIQKNIQVGEN